MSDETKNILVGALCAFVLMGAFYLLVSFACPSDWCGSDPEADDWYDQWVDWY